MLRSLRKTNSSAHSRVPLRVFVASVAWAWLLIAGQGNLATGQEANWIWSPEHPPGQAATGDCYLRRTMQLSSPVEEATVTLTADDRYELFVNGQKIGRGNSINQMEQYDIAKFLTRGRNVVAIRATNLAPGPAAVAARVFIKPTSGQWLSYSTDGNWRTALDASSGWQMASFNDSRWKPAQVFGMLGKTAPWDRREESDPQRISENQRFRISQEFAVDEILGDEQTGSLINLAFNEFGHIIASQENGPLLLIYDSNKDGVVDKVRNYCDLVQNIQGILPLNGDVFVTGTGPEGPGVYRLIDSDRNGALEEAVKLIGFKGDSFEHGAHGLTLGPDGRVYCVLGNHVQYDGEFAETSPLRNYYEGDLVRPKYEDPGGHASRIKAPGGTVIRFDVQAEKVELVAGGLRNAFDLTFHPNGSLYVHDSDMESDEGSVWYRPTSLYEVVEGGDFGWRSGWSKWPSYYYDRLPTLLETGRGSPTGACTYDHHMFPARYHGSLFLADWTEGQILCVRMNENGQAQSDVFIEGKPLNVTDVAVGPDGWLYFCTGGRGTKGGIYQVRWLGDVPESVTNLGNGIARAIKQPQLSSAWSRQEIATLKRELGSAWGDSVAGVAYSDENPAKYRLRALDLMQLFGPTPSTDLLIDLCKAPSEAVRARAARLLGLQAVSARGKQQLERMLSDAEPSVQTAAALALMRLSVTPEIDSLVPLLSEQDRTLSYVARRLLEQIPAEQWRDELLEYSDQRVQLQAGLALMIADPTPDNAQAVIDMGQQMLTGFISDRNFGDLLRLLQVTLHRSGLTHQDVPELAEVLAAEYPVGEPTLNRELFRLLAYVKADSVVPKAISYLQSDAPLADRLHIAMHLRFFDHQWTSAERYAVIKFFEETQPVDWGSSVPLYVMNVTRDMAKDLPMSEARIFVSEGAKWPNAALVSLFQYPEKLSESDLRTLKQLDQDIDKPGFEGEEYKRLRTGIVAMLSQHGDQEAMEYLREIWIRSPERRQAVALGLAQQPNDENWDYLVRSLPVLESYAVPEVMNAIRNVETATDDPQALREVILHGLRMEQQGDSAQAAVELLTYWTGLAFELDDPDDSRMQPWQAWYAKQYPTLPEAKLPEFEQSSPWSMDTLNEYFVSSDGRKGSLENGRLVYEKADCAKCHRMQGTGTGVGPDLTSIAARFTRKEVLQSILYPSHIISDQYQTKRVLTADGDVYSGIVSENTDGSISVRDSNLETHVIAEQDIELVELSKTSLMPSGLLDNLSAAEIRDLMTYMGFGAVQQVADLDVDSIER
ncbi:MAG: c-type cytochrome [bacterium]|nr:c-type cytochrome [bacterium]